jgi:hypothetical protein
MTKQIDWAGIESDFRAATASNRQIAKQHGISEGAIRKRAKLGNWVRAVDPKQKKTAGPITMVPPSGLSAQQLAAGDVDLAIAALTDICLNGKSDVQRVRAAKLLLRIADSKSSRSSGRPS